MVPENILAFFMKISVKFYRFFEENPHLLYYIVHDLYCESTNCKKFFPAQAGKKKI